MNQQTKETKFREFEFPRETSAKPSMDQIMSTIPKKYFEPSTSRSIRYFFQDVFVLTILYSILFFYQSTFDNYPILYLFIWFAIGTMFWALFVVGHDCGHRSFSKSIFICDLFGHLSHTPILVPFHPWRLSHQKHHKHTGDVREDESFVAVPERLYRKMNSFIFMVKFYTYPFFGYTLYLLGGMPIHFFSHFVPIGEVYNSTKKKAESMISITLTLLMIYFLKELYRINGFKFLLVYYLAPYLVFVAWIAIVTHLHHTHPDVPWYRGEKWSFEKGAMSTVDRNYGVFEDIHHNIGTHIVHHLCSKIPHYHLRDATESIRPMLGTNYRRSNVSTLEGMKMIFNYCRFVPNTGSILYFEQDWREIMKHPMPDYVPKKNE